MYDIPKPKIIQIKSKQNKTEDGIAMSLVRIAY